MGVDEDAIGRVFRDKLRPIGSCPDPAFGDINVAENAVQEAYAVALSKWPRDGLPANPSGCITTTDAGTARIPETVAVLTLVPIAFTRGAQSMR